MIELRGVKKRFGEQIVLDGVDFTVADGETVALLGASGTGKSVLLKHINGLIHPDAGTILVDGKNVATLKRDALAELRTSIGYVFQNGALFDSMDVFENVRLGIVTAEHYQDSAFCKDRVAECLRLVNLAADTAVKYPSQLSGGMRKRVGIARALASGAAILLYDEPTAGLDPVNTFAIGQLIARLKTKGVTQVVVTHDLDTAYRVADRIVMIVGGRILFEGVVQDLRNCRDQSVREFLDPAGAVTT